MVRGVVLTLLMLQNVQLEEIHWRSKARMLATLLSTQQPEEMHFKNVTVVKRVVPIMFGRSLYSNDTFIECSNSMEEFPSFFTDEQRKNGAIVIAFLVAIYCFTIIATIIDSYFLPCVERICETLHLSEDVAAATFMSIATSAPELFVNLIGTFVTESDIGIGTVVGSSMFNSLGVASVGGLAATAPIQLDWWPLTRDTFIYIVAILLLVSITWDGVVKWYEAMVLFFVYFLYFTVMFQNVRLSKFFKRCVSRIRPCSGERNNNNIKMVELKKVTVTDVSPLPSARNTVSVIDGVIATTNNGNLLTVSSAKENMSNQTSRNGSRTNSINVSSPTPAAAAAKSAEDTISIFRFPRGHWAKKVFFVYTWPIKLILYCTIPDPRKHRKWFPFTFVMCVIWIGTNSYIVSWMITIIGYTLGIQDSILGLTFLAAGGCLPEAISITIKSRKGEGAMGVSNALGANTMNILLSLGFPWFVKTTIQAYTKQTAEIRIVSGSLEYTILALVAVALTLYASLACFRFRLSRRNGCILMFCYGVFISFAILAEMVFFARVECTELEK